jgi:type I restriction-modification system DNA methylase subunit
VADHGEVYTPRRIVNAMLDLVKSQTERINSRFLGPVESIVRSKEAKDA